MLLGIMLAVVFWSVSFLRLIHVQWKFMSKQIVNSVKSFFCIYWNDTVNFSFVLFIWWITMVLDFYISLSFLRYILLGQDLLSLLNVARFCLLIIFKALCICLWLILTSVCLLLLILGLSPLKKVCVAYNLNFLISGKSIVQLPRSETLASSMILVFLSHTTSASPAISVQNPYLTTYHFQCYPLV